MYQPSTIARPRLERRLDGALGRRLTCVVAGPGFGKTTLLTRWAAGNSSAWHGLGPGDRTLGGLVRRVTDVLRARVAGLPPDLLTAVRAPRGPDTGTDEVGRAHGYAGRICEALATVQRRDLVLVLDDLEAIGGAAEPEAFVAGLCWQAPALLQEGEARQLVGDWDVALICFEEAAAGSDPLPPGLAWRMGLIHHPAATWRRRSRSTAAAACGVGPTSSSTRRSWRDGPPRRTGCVAGVMRADRSPSTPWPAPDAVGTIGPWPPPTPRRRSSPRSTATAWPTTATTCGRWTMRSERATCARSSASGSTGDPG